MKRQRWLKLSILAAAGYFIQRWFVPRRPPKMTSGAGRGGGSPRAVSEVGPGAERRSTPDPEALRSAAGGRGIGFDVERLKSLETPTYQPVVEYLSYIQVQRGDDQSIVFVRERDVDSLAALTGGSRKKFVDEFQQLGVLLSMN